MKVLLSTLCALFFVISCSGESKDKSNVPEDRPGLDNAEYGSVKISKINYSQGGQNSKQYYWLTEIDLTKRVSNVDIGVDYAKAINQLDINFTAWIDYYLLEAEGMTLFRTLGNKQPFTPAEFVRRVNDLYSVVPQGYREILSGMVEEFGGTLAYSGRERIFGYNLLPDIFRETNCSALGVMPDGAVDNNTVVGRVLDWNGGVGLGSDILSRFQSITKIKTREGKTIYLVGALGNLTGVTVINATSQIMGAILDAPVGEDAYSSKNKRSYPFELLYAIENFNNTNDIADHMKKTENEFTFNHLILLGSKDNVTILENNNVTSQSNPTVKREVRYWNSKQRDPIPTLDISFIIGAVNSFLLEGQPDNHFNPGPFAESKEENSARWSDMREQVQRAYSASSDGRLGEKDVISVLTYYPDSTPSDGMKSLYNTLTQQIIVYTPETNKAKIFMRPSDGTLLPDPKNHFFEFTFQE